MRVFLALLPDHNTKLKFKPVLKDLELNHSSFELKILPLDHLHLTLAFFENISSAQLEQLKIIIQSALLDIHTLPIEIERKLLLPSSAQAETLAYKIKLNTELKTLHEILSIQFALNGFPPDQHTFKPHISLARSKKAALLQNIELPQIEEIFYAQELVLFESQPTSGPFYYRVIEIFPLAGD